MQRELLSGGGRNSLLDPRSKIFLLITLSIFVLGGCGTKLPMCLYLLLGMIPFLLMFTTGQWKKATAFLIMYSLLFYADYSVLPNHSGQGFIFLSIVCQVAIRFLPCLILGVYAVSTTTVSEFIAGMEKMHIPDELTIPMSVMFRLFPTIGEELSDIEDACRMRGIQLGKASLEDLIEYRMVPLMICSVNIGEELSASALTRGLTSTKKRTNICEIGLKFQDYVAIGLCLLCFILWIFGELCQLLN